MKYINKEYGFSFRPPFFDKFYEENIKGPQMTDNNYPNGYIIGAGLDYSAINGAMLVGKHGSLWGIKVSYLDGNKWVDNDDFVRNMGNSSANTPDGSFAHFASGPLSVKWARHSEQGLAFEISARKRLRVRVIFYPCYGWPSELSIEGSFVKGRSPYVGIIPGEISLSDTNAVYRDRYQVIHDDKQGREYFKAQSYSKPMDTANGAFNEVMMDFIINSSQPRIYLYAAVGDEKVLGMDVPRMDKLAKLIETAELRYGVGKTTGTGTLGTSVETMLNSIMWSKIYYPYLKQSIYSPKRSMLNNHFDISGLEENCAALLGSYIGDGSMCESQLEVTTQDKVMAVLSIWHSYAHIFDQTKAVKLFYKLSKLYPPDYALVVADERTKNEVAYKWTDSLLKEVYNVNAMYSLDLTCLKLLAFDILERMAIKFKLPEHASYAKSKAHLISLINEVFWNDEKRLYMNRYLNSQWALNYGATSFYPLLAGAITDSYKLDCVVSALTNPKQFWGDYIVPTLSKDNRYYGKPGKPNEYGKKQPPFLQYRGSIVPYVNYFIYHGLIRYGLDEIAAEFATKSAKLWSSNSSSNVENYSLYLPTGNRAKSKEYLSNNGNMLALIGIQELIDIEYFRDDLKHAIRFGTLAKGAHSITNMKLLGKSYSIDVTDMRTVLLVDNDTVFVADGGRCVVRQYVESDKNCTFAVDAVNNCKLTLALPFVTIGNAPRKSLSLDVPAGKSLVVIDDGIANVKMIN